jgi:Ser/Thr protein kinase RdoA (MazF antagonist)
MTFNFAPDKLETASSLWSAVLKDKMNGNNHEFYAVTIKEQPAVMRLTPVQHRDMDSVLGEIEFMQYLHGKAPVAKVIPSLKKKLAEQIQIDGQQVIVCMFETIGGIRLSMDKTSEVGIMHLWGETMGSLHNLSKQYNHSKHYYRTLDGSVLLNLAKDRIKNDFEVIDLLETKWNEIQSSELIQNNWGVIHGDLTQSNMHFFKSKLYVFDFDECLLAPYLYDIAITIHITLISLAGKTDYQKRGENFVVNFIKGYKSKCNTVVNIGSLILLMDFFNILLYIHISQYASHPFKEYVLKTMKHGAFAGLNEKYINDIIY